MMYSLSSPAPTYVVWGQFYLILVHLHAYIDDITLLAPTPTLRTLLAVCVTYTFVLFVALLLYVILWLCIVEFR